ncbi:MAG: flippase-like domain-containing protein [Desulfuromonadales bacterium]|nr:flippase-like domain-containing protein [Desulfuromonadales bacterium]
MDKLKSFFKPIGYIVTALSVGYLGVVLFQLDWHSLQFKNPFVSILFILLFGLWASLFVVVGAYNWKLILEFVNGAPIPAKDLFPVYLKSNIAKYLPGNVMHYAGRNYLGSKLGWKNSEMAFSSLLEYIFGSGLTGIIIIIFIVCGLITIPPQITMKLDLNKIAGYSALGAAGGLIIIYLYRYFVRNEELRVTSRKLKERAQRFCSVGFMVLCAKLSVISLVCFVLNCAFYFYLCDLVLDFHIRPVDFFNANAALSIAGYMSILTPGVPGGLGVKESVSMVLMSVYGYPKESLMMSLLVFRIACVLGDVLPYVLVKMYEGASPRGANDI